MEEASFEVIAVRRVQLGQVITLYRYRLSFTLGSVQFNDPSAMKTLDELFTFRVDPVESKNLTTMGTRDLKVKHRELLNNQPDGKWVSSEFICCLDFS